MMLTEVITSNQDLNLIELLEYVGRVNVLLFVPTSTVHKELNKTSERNLRAIGLSYKKNN